MSLSSRQFKVHYLNATPQVVDAVTLDLEKHLKFFGNIETIPLENIAHLESKCDLLVIGAMSIPQDHFLTWLKSLSQRIQKQGGIIIPTIVVADLPFPQLKGFMEDAINMNWYFDVISTRHLDSLAMRVANLLRIHDHLHELKRYDQLVNDMSYQIKTIEAQLQEIQTKS